MGDTENVMPEGDRLKKAVQWICEVAKECPEKTHDAIVQEAEIRFDLTPRECEFLHGSLYKNRV